MASVVLLAILAHARTVLSEQVPCGCFGPLVLNNRIGVGQLILVVAMLLASVMILALRTEERYFGLYAQAIAVAAVMVLTCLRYLRLRRAA